MSRRFHPARAAGVALSITLVTALAVLAAGASCGQRTSSASSPSSVNVGADGSGTARIEGVTFEFDDSVRFRYQQVSGAPGSPTTQATVDGHEFGLRDGQVFVGEREYGPAESGATVRITRAGVTVGGELRGPLPEPRER